MKYHPDDYCFTIILFLANIELVCEITHNYRLFISIPDESIIWLSSLLMA